jgi:serine/threonine-protein phosphatase 6 regulatory subunit 3
MPRLIERLSPNYPTDMHAVVSEVTKNIITMAAPSPGSGLSEGLNNGPASNRFARELAQRRSLTTLTDFILLKFSPDDVPTLKLEFDTAPESSPLPDHESSSSAVVHSIGIIIELIRQNNSDYFEPYLFHTLRNRLIQFQQQLHKYADDGREVLEQAMQEMVNRMGVVHLGPLLEIMVDRLGEFQHYLKEPRSLVRLFLPASNPNAEMVRTEGSGFHHHWIHQSTNVRAIPDMRALCGTPARIKHVSSESFARLGPSL